MKLTLPSGPRLQPMRLRGWLITAATTGLAAGMLAAGAAPASAAAHAARHVHASRVSAHGRSGQRAPGLSSSCYGFSCHGHDQVIYGCASTSQVSSSYYSGRNLMATLINHYSAGCDANWTTGQISSYAASLRWTFRVTISTKDSHGIKEYMCWSGPNSPNNTGAITENCPAPPYYGGTVAESTDMVDGTNVTASSMYVYDAHGNLITDLTAYQ